MVQIGPYSRPTALAKLDGRTREARLLRQVRSELTAHVGGNPSAVERRLIERAAWLTLRADQLEAKIEDGGGLTDHDTRQYLAWSNGLARTLARLGLKGARAAPKTLADHIAGRRPEQAA